MYLPCVRIIDTFESIFVYVFVVRRWGFKFFNSEGDLKDGLSDKQHTFDKSTSAAEPVRQELERVAQILAAQKSKNLGVQVAAVPSDVRCKNISTALHSVVGDGQRDGSFHVSSGPKEAVGSVNSIARTHHAIYLLSPSMGQGPYAGELHGATELFQGGSTCDVLANAKRLNEAFIKYRIILQVPGVSSFFSGNAVAAKLPRSCSTSLRERVVFAAAVMPRISLGV